MSTNFPISGSYQVPIDFNEQDFLDLDEQLEALEAQTELQKYSFPAVPSAPLPTTFPKQSTASPARQPSFHLPTPTTIETSIPYPILPSVPDANALKTAVESGKVASSDESKILAAFQEIKNADEKMKVFYQLLSSDGSDAFVRALYNALPEDKQKFYKYQIYIANGKSTSFEGTARSDLGQYVVDNAIRSAQSIEGARVASGSEKAPSTSTPSSLSPTPSTPAFRSTSSTSPSGTFTSSLFKNLIQEQTKPFLPFRAEGCEDTVRVSYTGINMKEPTDAIERFRSYQKSKDSLSLAIETTDSISTLPGSDDEPSLVDIPVDTIPALPDHLKVQRELLTEKEYDALESAFATDFSTFKPRTETESHPLHKIMKDIVVRLIPNKVLDFIHLNEGTQDMIEQLVQEVCQLTMDPAKQELIEIGFRYHILYAYLYNLSKIDDEQKEMLVNIATKNGLHSLPEIDPKARPLTPLGRSILVSAITIEKGAKFIGTSVKKGAIHGAKSFIRGLTSFSKSADATFSVHSKQVDLSSVAPKKPAISTSSSQLPRSVSSMTVPSSAPADPSLDQPLYPSFE